MVKHTATSVVTIERYIIEQEKLHPEATGELSGLLYDLALAYEGLGDREKARARYREVVRRFKANRLVAKGLVHPTLSKTHRLSATGEAALEVHRNQHQGKVGSAASWNRLKHGNF